MFAATANETKVPEKIEQLDKPLYTPFVENYILNEIKTLREENRKLGVEMHETLTEKELSVSNKAIDYATSTINNMFYIIAAATSILVFLGWNSFRDINERIRITVDERISKVIDENEKRMQLLEHDLERRSRQVLSNQEEIAKTNTIHSLWMRAGLEQTPYGKIEIYDQILKIRPQDPEAISYKADAALDLGEANWALSLSNQSINIDPEYPNAYYQRACAYSVLKFSDNAIDDLEKALELNENYTDEILSEKEFIDLHENERFQKLLSRYQTKNT
ncbi:tetratricopeptide repeat protein [Sulfurimonas marina]|uniref:tetratricopeptide repeat protein n=1 Tax=Sulfurimonas marina TaxID=2590551 RepID=UPI001865DE86|nr:tetratricopeptide repeat protein [Sulfurimonas marina]